MPYETEKPNTGRMIGIGLVVLLHIGFIYALANGLSRTVVEIVKGPIIAEIIETPPEVKNEEPPPPPPPVLDEPPPPFVPMPEVQINLPPPAASNAITSVQSNQRVSSGSGPRSDPAHPNRHPVYPPAARMMEEEGTVTLRLLVAADGTVREAHIKQTSGSDLLDEAAVKEALRSWKFLPARNGGTAVAGWLEYKVIFKSTDI